MATMSKDEIVVEIVVSTLLLNGLMSKDHSLLSYPHDLKGIQGYNGASKKEGAKGFEKEYKGVEMEGTSRKEEELQTKDRG